MDTAELAQAYALPGRDPVRAALEVPALTRAARGLLRQATGGAVLELGCGAGLARQLAGPSLERYLGIDLRPPAEPLPGPHRVHDLRDGLGPAGDRPFDLYLAGFGLASHLAPVELERLLADIAAHARPGSLVALEALGLHSLEWPGLWDTQPGLARTLSYPLAADVVVHPWAPAELAAVMEGRGIVPLRFADRSLQSGPKLDCSRYWPGLPAVRTAMAALLEGAPPAPALTAPLPPLPAGRAAAVHQRLAERRRGLTAAHAGPWPALARRLWAAERGSAGGFGHGLLAIGRVA